MINPEDNCCYVRWPADNTLRDPTPYQMVSNDSQTFPAGSAAGSDDDKSCRNNPVTKLPQRQPTHGLETAHVAFSSNSQYFDSTKSPITS